MNGTSQWWRIGGYCGIAFMVLFLVFAIGVQGSTPTYGDSIDKVRAYWADNSDKYLFSDIMIGIAFLFFFLPFLVTLRALLGRAEGGIELLAQVSFLGGLLFLLVGMGASVYWGTLAFDINAFDDSTLQVFMAADNYAFSGGGIAVATMVLPASYIIWQTGVLWRGLAVLGAILSVAGVISAFGVLDPDPEDALDIFGWLAFIGLGLWVLGTSIAMARRSEAPAAATASGTQAAATM